MLIKTSNFELYKSDLLKKKRNVLVENFDLGMRKGNEQILTWKKFSLVKL